MMLKSFITKFHQIPKKLITKNTVVDELWKLKLDEDEEKDKVEENNDCLYQHWLIGKKQTNKAKKSIVFSKMVDAFYYQEEYGGDISIITETKWDGEVNGNDDCLLEFDDKGNAIEPESDEKECAKIMDECKHYVLNICDTKTLLNGYGFIKELILQHHNFDMNETYTKLKDYDVEVYSVKTDLCY